MAAPNLTELATTTLRNRTGKLADNVSKNNALLMKLNESGTIRYVSGGRTIVQELDYTENVTYKRYSGYETLDISQSETFSAAEFDWKQAAVAVSMSGLEMVQNSGKEAIIDLLGSRIINAERTFSNNMSTDCYSDGSASGSKQVGGLQLLVADTPTNTVGGIDRGTWTFWRNISYDATTDGGAALTSSNVQRYMNRVYARLQRGNDRPNVIIADNNYFTAYEESLQPIQRITNDRTGNLGFSSYKYKDVDVILDGGFQGPTTTPFSTSAVAGGCPVNHMYFLNTKYIHFRPYRGRNMELLEPEGGRFSVNQDAMVKLLAFAGNMTLSCGFLQGVLKD